MSREMTAEEYVAYIEGIKEGLRQYAWWKDGVQYVGTCGKTLKQAIEEAEDLQPIDKGV
jgi:hypothetical protein